jgi:hypothetical protein
MRGSLADNLQWCPPQGLGLFLFGALFTARLLPLLHDDFLHRDGELRHQSAQLPIHLF